MEQQSQSHPNGMRFCDPKKPTPTRVTVSRYYPARLVKFGWPWLDPKPVGALNVRVQVDQEFASLLRDDINLRHGMSDYLHGILTPATTTQSTYGKLVCGILERTLLNRARFAIQQYRWAANHYDSIPTHHKDRLCSKVKLEVRYVMALLTRPKAKSFPLLRLYKILETLAKDDFGGHGDSPTVPYA